MPELYDKAETINVGILIFDDVEVLDFCGPFEVLSTAGRLKATGGNANSTTDIAVFTIAETNRIIKARGNLLVQPHFTIHDYPPIDVLIVPGGWGTRKEVNNANLINWISKVTGETQLNTSVCTGAFMLAKTGLLDNRKATTHWASLDRLSQEFPAVQVQREVRWVEEGNIITSAGISAGIDMALHIVERLFGRELALQTAKQMEYVWQENKR